MGYFSALTCAALLITQVLGEYGVAHFSALGESKEKDYCIHFNSRWTPLPLHLNTMSAVEVYDLTPSVLCSDSDVPDGGFPDHVAMAMWGNCTLYEKVCLAQSNGAKGLLIISKAGLITPKGNESQYEEINIPLAVISYTDMLDIRMRFRDRKQVVLYSPKGPWLDVSVVLMFLMAVGTVAGGGYWTGVQEIKKLMKEEASGEKEESETVNITMSTITVWVAMCSLMLVLLYMFYSYLVFIYIGFFCLVSSMGLYNCLWLIVHRIPVGKCRIPENKLPYLKKRPDVRMLLLGLLCVSVSITWAVFRNDDWWAWVLQDTLGMASCLYILTTFRLPSFRACTLLLTALLVYDVFFVFITPYITKSGESIMVEVGVGPSDSSTQEKLPVVLKVPYMTFSAVVLCNWPFLLLGLGDIIIPGLHVAYCHRFDVLVNSPKVYFLASTVGYTVGLILSFVCAFLMNSAQPALLYLVPFTLLFSLLVALWRSELKPYWKGAVSLPSPVAMTPVTQTLNPPTSESSANQEPDVSDVTNQGEDPPPPTEEERLQRTEASQ
ncbi:signal peptide peptidase-like 2 [Ictalurus punctatus]|uniref:Signal peptide peptidase-like 2 n=1 Tax=Ictalurus punctatus TaxID=7998 RepID=A0A9F7TJM9_ICTPU|nr:signal peptide peptidase-like 2 [Ictalurus punctatus]